MSTLLKLATPIKASNLYKSCVCVPKKLHNRRPQTVCVFQHRNTLQLQFATSRAGRQRIARQRQAQQSRAGRQIKDCEAVSGGHGSPELEDKCKGLEGKGGSLCPPCLPLSPVLSPSCWSLCPPYLPSVSFCLPSCHRSCLPSCWSLRPACFPILTICLPALVCCVAMLYMSPSSGLLCPPLACNPYNISSELLCPPLPCNPLDLLPSSGLLCPAQTRRETRRETKGDRTETTNKTRDKEREKGDKADTMTNKKVNKRDTRHV